MNLEDARRGFKAYGHRNDYLGEISRRNYYLAMKADLDKWCDEKAAERERLQDLGRVA